MEDGEKSRKRHRGDDPVGRPKDAETPSLKEVEEFLEILRRVHVAVRYFDKRVSPDGRDGFSGRLREALETGLMEPAVASQAKSRGLSFDLNGEPDPDTPGMAVNEGVQPSDQIS